MRLSVDGFRGFEEQVNLRTRTFVWGGGKGFVECFDSIFVRVRQPSFL